VCVCVYVVWVVLTALPLIFPTATRRFCTPMASEVCTRIQTYKRTNVQTYKYTNIQYTNIQIYHHGLVQRVSRIQTYKHTNIQYTNASPRLGSENVSHTNIRRYPHDLVQRVCKAVQLCLYISRHISHVLSRLDSEIMCDCAGLCKCMRACGPAPCTVVILLLHYCYTVVTLLLHCCHTVVTLLLYCCCTVVTLLLHCCCTVVTLLLHCCCTVVTLLLHCCCTVVTRIRRCTRACGPAPCWVSASPSEVRLCCVILCYDVLCCVAVLGLGVTIGGVSNTTRPGSPSCCAMLCCALLS
jgi:hypothetical protein